MLLMGGDLLHSFSVPNLWNPKHVRATCPAPLPGCTERWPCQLEEIVRDFGIVVIPRPGTDANKFVYDSDLLTRHEVRSLLHLTYFIITASTFQHNIFVVPSFITNDISSTHIR